MIESENPYRRYAELMDRQALGEALSAEELAFCERLSREHPLCARETELWKELAQLDEPPSQESRALVDATLARLAVESQKAEQAELTELKRGARAPRFLWVSGALAVAAVALAIVLVPNKPAPSPVIATVQPVTETRVELVYAGGEVTVDGRAISSGTTLLAEGSVVDVGRGAACIAMDPGIDLCASADTRLRLSRVHSPWRRIDLERGKLATQLSPQPEGSHLSIVAGNVWSTAVGTAFTVERQGEDVSTTVLHGKVRVGSDGGREQLVGAHQRARVHGEQATLAAVSRSDESPEWALLGPAKLWSNPVSATLELRGLPAGAEVMLDGQVIGLAPLSTLIPAGNHRLQVRVNGKLVLEREFVSAVGERTALQLDPRELRPQAEHASQPAHTLIKARVLPEPVAEEALPPGAAELLAQARQALRDGDFGQAAEQYQALRSTYPASPEARAVLVSLAQLQVDRLGRARDALASTEQYLQSGPGPLAQEARQVRIRALRSLGERDREALAIEEFLSTHPKSLQASALEHRLAELKDAR